MRLYIIRHATALSVSEANVSDDTERPLSEKGIAEAQLLGAYLKSQGIHLNVILHSPLVRATETAALISEQLGCKAIPEARLSTSSGLRTHLDVLADYKQTAHLAIVGHQPILGDLLSTVGNPERPVSFSPGSMAIVDVAFAGGSPAGALISVHSPETL